MKTTERKQVTVEATVKAPIEKVWDAWTRPEQVIRWNNASDDWHTPRAESDLRPGGGFVYRMEAKDGSVGFDFAGVYDEVRPYEFISFTMSDWRQVEVFFSKNGDETKVKETFEAENENSIELQRSGWQSILDNFKRYTESR